MSASPTIAVATNAPIYLHLCNRTGARRPRCACAMPGDLQLIFFNEILQSAHSVACTECGNQDLLSENMLMWVPNAKKPQLRRRVSAEHRQVMEMVEEASIATVCDAAAMTEHRQGPLRPWLGRRSDRQATIGMDCADERSGRLSEMKQV